MDPQAALDRALELYRYITRCRAFFGWPVVWDSTNLIDEACEMDDCFTNLYNWLRTGGFAPSLRVQALPTSPAGLPVGLVVYTNEAGEVPYQINVRKPRPRSWADVRFVFSRLEKGIPVAFWQLR